MKVKDLVYVALFTALIAVCAQISIPTTIPFTLQTFAVFTACALLKDKRALFTVLIYVFLGAVGVPVFAGFKGGVGVLASATGGFILGFLFIPPVMTVAQKRFGDSPLTLALSMVAGLILCYTLGAIWFTFVYTAESISFLQVLKLCVLPFLAADAGKIALATLLCTRLLRIPSVRLSLCLPPQENKQKPKEPPQEDKS